MPPYTQAQKHRGRRKNREGLATTTARGFNGQSTQDALRTVQSGNGTDTRSRSGMGASPTSTPEQAGTINAAAPGTFNGNPANGIPSSEVGFSSAASGGGGGQTGTWDSGGGGELSATTYDPNAFAYTQGVYSPQGSGAAGTENEVTRELPVQPGTEGMTWNDATGMWEAGADFQASPGWDGTSLGGGGNINVDNGVNGYMDREQYDANPMPTTGMENILATQGSSPMDALNLDSRTDMGSEIPGGGSTYGDIQRLIDQGGTTGGFGVDTPRGNNWDTGPGAPGAGGQEIRDDLALSQAPLASWSQPDGDGVSQYTQDGPGKTGESTAGETSPLLSGFAGADGNINEKDLKKSLGYGSKEWSFPDFETFQPLGIDAPYTANLSEFLQAGGPLSVTDPDIQRILGKYERAAQVAQEMENGAYSAQDKAAAWNEYNTLQAALGMYGVNWNPLEGLTGPIGGGGGGGEPPPPPDDAGGRRDTGGGVGRGRFEGHVGNGGPRFPDSPQTGEPGAIDWTRDDFNRSTTDVMDSVPRSMRIDGEIQRMFGAQFASASPQEKAAMYEMAKSSVMADEQLSNKQSGIDILQGGFDQTTRENNPLRRMSENAALDALQNPNPVDLEGIQARTAADYDSALNQGIQAQSGSGARRGLSAGSQAGMAGAMTAANRRDLSRTLGEQTTAYQMAERQSLYDAINNAARTNQNYLGGELQQRGLLANAVRGAYDPAQNVYEGATAGSIDLATLKKLEELGKDAGDSSWLDYANVAGSLFGGLL